MALNVYYDKDADFGNIKDKKITVLGYGSQGHAQAQNLRDSGYTVVVALDPGRGSAKQAAADGFEVLPVPEAVKKADVIFVAVPDTKIPDVFNKDINFARC